MSDSNSYALDLDESLKFIKALGKDPATTWLRCLPNAKFPGSPGHHGISVKTDRDWIESKSKEGFNLCSVIGNATSATGKGGGVRDIDITGMPAFFVEWDDGARIEEQTQRWQKLGLPEPTVMVSTGGKSVHCYWVLAEQMEPETWRLLQKRLITHCDSDQACSNPSRLMRLPGSIYYNKTTGEATGECRIIHAIETRYSATEIEECLPAPEPAPERLEASEANKIWEPRSIDEINSAADYIPKRVVDGDTYHQSRNAICGCSAALKEAGAEDPDGMALALLGHLWPDEKSASNALRAETRAAGSFWKIAREHGHEFWPNVLKVHAREKGKQKGSQCSENEQQSYSELLGEMLAATIADDDDKLMQLRAETMNRFRRTDAQIEAALFKRHTKRRVQGKSVTQPESLDLSRISGMDWLIEGFIPDNDLTLIWGTAGCGKTTAGLALASSTLFGTGLLDHTQPAPKCNVLFIASDSGAPPLYAAMQETGMASKPEVQNGPQKRFHVWASDAEQGMTAWAADLRGCIRLLDFINRHQIGLVLIDSCKAVCSGAGLDYTNNLLVTELLTYFKEVICPHAAVVWLNHDGVAKGANAGAKAWKEIPSVVHSIIREENKDGSFSNDRRIWRVTKSRMGSTREFFYELIDGQISLCSYQERVGNCLACVMDVLKTAWHQGEESMAKAALVERICTNGGHSRKTLDNTLSTATRAKHPDVCRAGRGHYKLSPRNEESLHRHKLNGKEEGQNLVLESDLSSTPQVPMGTSLELSNFPSGSNGKSIEHSDTNRSEQVTPHRAYTPLTDEEGLALYETAYMV